MNQHLLLLHGALGSKDQFKSLKEKLTNQFDVHTFDFEGHGKRASSNDFTMKTFVANVIQYLQEHKIEKANIFGYSMGGYVALNLAKNRPELVEKIMTLGTKFNWTKETAEKEIRMLNPEKIEEKVPAFADQLATIHSSNNWKEVVNKTAKMMYELGTDKKLTTTDLAQIKHDVLIGIGGKDKMVSIEESTKSAHSLPNGQLVIIENFQHPIEKINEDKLTSILSNFIKA